MIDSKQSNTSSQFGIGFRDDIITEDNYPDHHHSAREIVLFLNADLKMLIEDKQYDIRDGDIMIVHEYAVHKVLYTPGSRYCRYVIHIEEWFMDNILKALDIGGALSEVGNTQPILLHTKLKERNKLRLYFDAVYNAYKNSQHKSSLHSNAEFKVTLAHLLINLDIIIKECAMKEPGIKRKDPISDIIRYIDTHYMNTITLDQLETEFFLSKYHISHLFKSRTGFSVMEYVQVRRVAEVQKMLVQSQKETTLICYECGFNNIQHFYRVFKKITGLTPEQYRVQSLK